RAMPCMRTSCCWNCSARPACLACWPGWAGPGWPGARGDTQARRRAGRRARQGWPWWRPPSRSTPTWPSTRPSGAGCCCCGPGATWACCTRAPGRLRPEAGSGFWGRRHGQPAAAVVVVAAALRLALEAAMDPQVLGRRLAHHGLDRGVDPGGIGDRVLAGEIRQRRGHAQDVAAALAAVEERHHRAAGDPRQLVGGGDGRGRHAEERREYRILAAHVL